MFYAFDILSRHWILYKQYDFYYFLAAFFINYVLPFPPSFYLTGNITESIIKEYVLGFRNVFEGVLLPWSIRQIFTRSQKSSHKSLFGLDCYSQQGLNKGGENLPASWGPEKNWAHTQTPGGSGLPTPVPVSICSLSKK